MYVNMMCKYCGSKKIVKIGKVRTLKELKQRFKCQNCGKTLYIKDPLDVSEH